MAKRGKMSSEFCKGLESIAIWVKLAVHKLGITNCIVRFRCYIDFESDLEVHIPESRRLGP